MYMYIKSFLERFHRPQGLSLKYPLDFQLFILGFVFASYLTYSNKTQRCRIDESISSISSCDSIGFIQKPCIYRVLTLFDAL